uniref:Uncharacterized protein n=1 Tax=Tanacetum cinerariifolium TaxID=118510 RepID=A0A6L2K3E0_TANCI|nr:hypothetical protein [Tanacetum cinerariifolium]
MWMIYNNNNTSSRFNAEEDDDDDGDDDDRDSSSSSSIGNNSDASDGGGDSDDDVSGGELQSLFKGSLNNLADLENALPLKRGISTFYAGKSKSYTSLADAVSAPSIQDIVKPEDAYNRKRKNILAHTVLLDKSRNFPSKSGISKRINNNQGSSAVGESSSLSSSPSGNLPPLPARPKRLPTKESFPSSPKSFCSPWRSLSLSDLQHAAGSSSSVMGSRGVALDHPVKTTRIWLEQKLRI